MQELKHCICSSKSIVKANTNIHVELPYDRFFKKNSGPGAFFIFPFFLNQDLVKFLSAAISQTKPVRYPSLFLSQDYPIHVLLVPPLSVWTARLVFVASQYSRVAAFRKDQLMHNSPGVSRGCSTNTIVIH